MTALTVLFVPADMTQIWPDIFPYPIQGTGLVVAVLDKGTESGAPSVIMRVDTDAEDDHGKIVVITQTSAKLFCMAAKTILGKYPNLLD